MEYTLLYINKTYNILLIRLCAEMTLIHHFCHSSGMLNVCLCQFPILAQFNELRTGERIWTEKRDGKEIETAYENRIFKIDGNSTELFSG